MTNLSPGGSGQPLPQQGTEPCAATAGANFDFGPYSLAEIREIQAVISQPVPKLDSLEIETIRQRFGALSAAHHLVPFAPLAARNPNLFTKIDADERVRLASLFCFFPESLPLFYQGESPVTLHFATGTRGLTAILEHPTRNIVIKPLQSGVEANIAQIVAGLGIGPAQLPSLKGFLTEDFIQGQTLSRLRRDQDSEEHMRACGQAYGEMLLKLHSHHLYYNDQALCDDMGKSHLIVPDSGRPVLIDFGRTINLSNFPDLSDEEVFNFMDTRPQTQVIRMLRGDIEPRLLVQDGRAMLKDMSKDTLFADDVFNVSVGLHFATDRIGASRCQAFWQGFVVGYPEAQDPTRSPKQHGD